MTEDVLCPYCGSKAVLTNLSDLFPNKGFINEGVWRTSRMYVCSRYPKCDARVGCHPNTEKPLGFLANAKLRNARRKAHTAFDPIWKNKVMPRYNAYDWLSKRMGVHIDDCHFGNFDLDDCHRAEYICRAFLEYRLNVNYYFGRSPQVIGKISKDYVKRIEKAGIYKRC